MKLLWFDGGAGPGTAALGSDLPRPGSREAGDWLLVNPTLAVSSAAAAKGAAGGLGGGVPRNVLLTDAQIDQVAGLIGLRDGAPIDLYATPAVFEDLTTTLAVLPQLERHCGVHWHMVPVAGDQTTAEFEVRRLPGLRFTAVAAPAAPVPAADPAPAPGTVGQSIGLAVLDRADGRHCLFARPADAMSLAEAGALAEIDCLIVDAGPRPDDDTLQWLRRLPVARKLLLGADIRSPRDGIESVRPGQPISV